LELAEPLVHSAERVADKDIGLGRTGGQHARKREQLTGKAVNEPTDRVLIAGQSGFD
jgi:hypothetical protein